MTIDRPLKFFLWISAVFIGLLGTFYITTRVGVEPPLDGIPRLHEEDPLLLDAKSQALSTLDTMKTLIIEYPDNTYVKFSYKPHKKSAVHVWGKVLDVGENTVTVSMTDVIADQGTTVSPVPLDEIEDWLVELEDGSIRGGYTTQVLLIREKQYELLEDAYEDADLKVFRDRLDESSF